MSHLLHTMLNDIQSDWLADILQNQHSTVLEEWKNLPRVQNVLTAKQIDPDFFINHFGSRVLDYFIGVLRREKAPGQCPVIIVMLKFFDSHNLTLDDIYQICAGKRNRVIHTLLKNGITGDDTLFDAAIELFDANFTGVIQEYLSMTYVKKMADTVKAPLACELNPVHSVDHDLINDYFSATEDSRNDEKVLFRTDDADDILEYFSEMSELLSFAMLHRDPDRIIKVANIFSKVASILLHYTPYLDSLAASMSELSTALHQHTDAFMAVLIEMGDGVLKLFDGVNADMDRYVQRFAVESIAMKNAHHIHEPTSLSIRQIVIMFNPSLSEENEIDFF